MRVITNGNNAFLATLAANFHLLRHEVEITKIDAKLSNKNFVDKAPEEVIEEQRDRRADADATRAKLAEALTRLG